MTTKGKTANPSAWPVYSTKPWPIEDVLPYARNARQHSSDQVAKLAALITEFGWTMPILVDEGGEIVAGHGRVLAAKRLGLDEVPVAVASGWTDEQIKAYRIADNRLAELSSWDEASLRIELDELQATDADLTLTGFSIVELDKLMSPVDATDPAEEWEGMPEFDQKDKTAFRTIPVHFPDQAAVDAFAELINQTITAKTRFVWFPEIEIERYADKRYVTEG